ncbi:MAG: ABC-F family ATP-binding cassette domain-containing protein [Gemmatimonadales bacterium]
MTLLGLSGIGIRFADTTILADVTALIGRGERWGLVGRNGAGKTSLFEAITGGLTPAAGLVTRATGLRVAVLDQHRTFGEADTVWDAAAGGYRELRQLERTLAEQTEAMSLPDADLDGLMADYARNLERFEHGGGYAITARVDAILDGLGFDPEASRRRLVTTLSGGERGRVALAAQLAADADLLLLDEPTNHLDIAGIRWLERHLQEGDRAAVIISHDRIFLDNVVDHVLHLEGGTAVAYTGNYQSFGEQRAFRRLSAERAFEKQAKSIAREEDFIRRNLAGQNSTQAVGGGATASAPAAQSAAGRPGRWRSGFDARERGGDQVLTADGLGIDLGTRTLLDGFSATIRRGDVVGLVGPNGAARRRCCRSSRRARPDPGSSRLGDSIDVAYYRQDLGDVPADRTLFDLVHDLKPHWSRGQVHDHLGRIGFTGDQARRRAGSLSGGELARVAIGKLMLSGANFLVFDEPTNHLDVETIEVLEDAIDAYPGTVLLVSHDRALLRSLTTRTWALADGRIEDFPAGMRSGGERGPAGPCGTGRPKPRPGPPRRTDRVAESRPPVRGRSPGRGGR